MKRKMLLLCILSTPALAAIEYPQLHVGVKGGYQWGQDELYNYSAPESGLFGIYGGLNLSPTWRWDVGYQYHDVLNANTTAIDVDVWLIESAFRYDWQIQEHFSLYGRAGFAYWNMEKTVAATADTLNTTGYSPLLEVGLSYALASNVHLSAGYQYIDKIGSANTGQFDSQAVTVGISYTFGRSAPVLPTIIDIAQPACEAAENPVQIEEEAVIVPAQALTFDSTRYNGLFGFGSAELPEAIQGELAEVAEVLNSYPQAQVIIIGHTDFIGSAEFNQVLSKKRAQTIADHLFNLGVVSGQVEIIGKGASDPIADNNTATGRMQNRRVEITIPSFPQ